MLWREVCWLGGEEDRKFGVKLRMDRLVPIAGAGEMHACMHAIGCTDFLICRRGCVWDREKRREEEDSRVDRFRYGSIQGLNSWHFFFFSFCFWEVSFNGLVGMLCFFLLYEAIERTNRFWRSDRTWNYSSTFLDVMLCFKFS